MDLLYTVITADVVDSRHQSALLEAKKELVQGISSPNLVAPFTFSRGDEIQGVYTGTFSSPNLLRQLRYICQPLQLRVGIGIGRVTSGLDARSSWEMNGPAFYRARQALDEVKKERHLLTKLVSGDQNFDQFLNALLALYDIIQSGWTPAQWEGVMVYEEQGTYKKAAAQLGVAFQNVEKRCRAANWWAIKQAENTMKSAVLNLTDINLLLGE